MVSLKNYYDKVEVYNDRSLPLGKRLQSLLDEVVERLPSEEQFGMKGTIAFETRSQAIKLWNKVKSKIGFGPEFDPHNRDGNCTCSLADKIEDSFFSITIIVDDLDSRSDDYIKGLIAHELSEMSYSYKAISNEKNRLLKLKPKARKVLINQITKQNAVIDSADHKEYEENVDKEAKRLGFEKEIAALNA